jgi:virulence-associated protein VapD
MKSARAFIIETRNKFQKHVAEMGSKLTELENNIITFQTRFADNKNYGKFYGRGFFELQEFSPIVKRFQKEMGTIYMRAEVIQEVLDFFNKKIERVDYFTQSVEEWKKNTLEKNRKLRRP